MKRFLIALAMFSVLSAPVSAGQIPTLPEPEPPPQGVSTAISPGESPTVPGDIPSVPGDIPTLGWSALLSLFGFLTV